MSRPKCWRPRRRTFSRNSAIRIARRSIAYGFGYRFGPVSYLLRQLPGDPWERLARGRPAVVRFWYRSSPAPLAPRQISDVIRVQLNDPPSRRAGNARTSTWTPRADCWRWTSCRRCFVKRRASVRRRIGGFCSRQPGWTCRDSVPREPQWTASVAVDARAAWDGSLSGSAGDSDSHRGRRLSRQAGFLRAVWAVVEAAHGYPKRRAIRSQPARWSTSFFS